MIDALPLLLGPEGYQISRSVRLRSSASAYFNRTLGTATNSILWTHSAWIKRGALSASQFFLYARDSAGTNNRLLITFDSSNTLVVYLYRASDGAYPIYLYTTAVFRDPSAWYHVQIAYDSANATTTNRVRIYVNGVLQTISGTVTTTPSTSPSGLAIYPTSSLSGVVNTAVAHDIGRESVTPAGYFDGYLTEINFIDGQALTPASFGETNAVTGVWQPKKYAGTYGTNGFYLNFSDNSAATAAAIGKDYSGNGNNWTPNNISVTAGVTYDSMLDVPTLWADGGNGRGNYCTLNPLVTPALSGGGTLSNGNLRIAGTVSVSNAYARGTMALSGKFYAEFFFDVVNATASIGVDAVTATSGALATSSTSVSYRSGGNKRVLGTESAYGASWVANDIIGVAVDTAANTVEFFKNGTSQGVITSSAFFAQGDCVFAMAKDDIGSPTGFANFGQRPFTYTPPTGFKALNTLNLPTPTILKGNQYFDATTYTGTGATQSIVNSGAMQPDLIWFKSRSSAAFHALFDSVRGRASGLASNATDAEATSVNAGDNLVSFNSNGFTVGSVATAPFWNSTNGNTLSLVAWQWKANGTPAVTNTAGSITSQVSAGANQGFSIVTYTGTGANATVGHGLGVAPKWVIVRNRNGGDWKVYTETTGNTTQGFLNDTAAFQGSSPTLWNSTSPTSTVFSIGTNAGVNQSSAPIVAYLFAAVSGYSAFGSYLGNGSADGPFIFTGFRPRYVMIKGSSFVSNWFVIDTSRSSYNVSLDALRPNLDGAEVSSPTTTYSIDILSNGFKLRTSAGDSNTNGATFIYACFAENPFKNALAR